eukprot:GSChrysophyteH1.ASY1.ANO1.777.1 assembled CDS
MQTSHEEILAQVVEKVRQLEGKNMELEANKVDLMSQLERSADELRTQTVAAKVLKSDITLWKDSIQTLERERSELTQQVQKLVAEKGSRNDADENEKQVAQERANNETRLALEKETAAHALTTAKAEQALQTIQELQTNMESEHANALREQRNLHAAELTKTIEKYDSLMKDAAHEHEAVVTGLTKKSEQELELFKSEKLESNSAKEHQEQLNIQMLALKTANEALTADKNALLQNSTEEKNALQNSTEEKNALQNSTEEKNAVTADLEATKAELQSITEEMEAKINVAIRANEAQCELNIAKAMRKKIHNKLLELQGNIRVICRVRPEVNITEITNDQDIFISRDEGNQRTKYEYDKIFADKSNQSEVFDSVKPLCKSVLDGYNVCIFAYGQTGSGKTFTMDGTDDNPGITPRALRMLMNEARNSTDSNESDWQYKLQLSVVEIYNEAILDLLVNNNNVGANGEMADEIQSILNTARKNRAVGAHDLNEHSSRSHCILTVYANGTNRTDGRSSYAKMHLIDLAGSERVSKTDATGDRLKEAQNINKSLSALGDVIAALGGKKGTHVPFRNSKLTHLLQDSLGGNSKVLMFVNISPAVYNESETVCSLTFATRCRNVELGQARKRISTSSVKLDA